MTYMVKAKQIVLTRRSQAYWRVTFDHPPLNIFGPETIPQLSELITALEQDPDVKVVVFDSAVEGFFLTHYDLERGLQTPGDVETRLGHHVGLLGHAEQRSMRS